MSTDLPYRIPLNDHALFLKAQGDRLFRNALILNMQEALDPFRITPWAENRLSSILLLIDNLTDVISRHYAEDSNLKQLLENKTTRRALLFAPKEASKLLKLPSNLQKELAKLSDMANVIAEAVLGAGEGE